MLLAIYAAPAPSPPVAMAVDNALPPATTAEVDASALPANAAPATAPRPMPTAAPIAAPVNAPFHILPPEFAALTPPMMPPTTAPMAPVTKKNACPVGSIAFTGLLPQ